MSPSKSSQPRSSTEETDQLTRSNKKYKRKITNWIFDITNDEDANMENSPGLGTVPLGTTLNQAVRTTPPPSFRDMLSVRNHSYQDHQQFSDSLLEDEVSDDDCAPDEFINNAQCPAILLTKEEKLEMLKP